MPEHKRPETLPETVTDLSGEYKLVARYPLGSPEGRKSFWLARDYAVEHKGAAFDMESQSEVGIYFREGGAA